jgi:magnesium-transporting ATPase (P-type)
MTDFAKISLATDNVRPSQQPDTWNVTGMVKTAVVLGLAMVVEALGLLWIGWQQFRLAFNESALHTFTFETLLFFAIFSLLAVRNRGRFWASRPSRTLGLALLADGLLATLIGTLGLAGLAPLPLWQTLFVLAYAGVFSLLVNDWIKTVLLQPADA